MNEIFDIQQLTQFEFGAIVLTVLVAGLVFGCLIAWGLLNRKSSPKAVEAEKVKEELKEYKEKVDEHFTQTSEMFKDVTTQYKKLYDHMAVGAVSLGNADTIAMPRLEMQESEVETEIAAQEPDIEQTDDIVEQDSAAEETPEQEHITEETTSAENDDETIAEKATETLQESVDELVEEQAKEENKKS